MTLHNVHKCLIVAILNKETDEPVFVLSSNSNKLWGEHKIKRRYADMDGKFVPDSSCPLYF